VQETAKIMVVDDEEEICSILQSSLTSAGYKVTSFSSPTKAIDRIKKKDIDILISDIKMPHMDGLELVRCAKSYHPDLRCVLMTGFASTESAIQALRHGVDDYTVKPFNLADVQKTVEKLIEKRRRMQQKEILIGRLKRENQKLAERRKRLEAGMKNAESRLQRINCDLEKRLDELGIISEVGKIINSVLDSEKLFNLCLKLVCKKMGVQSCSIMLYDPVKRELVVEASEGAKKPPVGTVEKIGHGIAGWVAKHKKPLLIKDVTKDKRFARSRRGHYKSPSCISVPIMQKRELAGVINISDKSSQGPFTRDDLKLFMTLASQISVAVENAKLYRTVQENYLRTIQALAVSLEAKDIYTSGHSVRVTEYAGKLAQEMKLDEKEQRILYYAAKLHDIGKIGVNEKILQKPGKLDPEEYEIIKQHPVIGEKIVGPLVFLKEVRSIIRGHHESYDGSGYPDGLRGEQIPLAARILRVADAYDAMTSERPYRKAMTSREALGEIKRSAGKDFAPEVVKALIAVIAGAGKVKSQKPRKSTLSKVGAAG